MQVDLEQGFLDLRSRPPTPLAFRCKRGWPQNQLLYCALLGTDAPGKSHATPCLLRGAFWGIRSFVQEQTGSAGPGRRSTSATGQAAAGAACPVIQRGGLATSYDITRAALMGASAVMLPPQAGRESGACRLPLLVLPPLTARHQRTQFTRNQVPTSGEPVRHGVRG